MTNHVTIHPTALVEKGAELDSGVVVGPFCIIGPNVKIGKNTKLQSHVVVQGHTTIGENNSFYQFGSIGEAPQDLTYKNEPTRLQIGNDNVIREYVSIHRGTMKQDQVTIVGNKNLIMAYAHLGHDVCMGNNCVIVNSVNLAGHVVVEDRVIISGATNVSQFLRIGRGAYIGGASGVDHDIPPFCAAYGNRVKLKGVNIVGLRRQGFEKPVISEAVDFFRTMEAAPTNPRAFVESAELMADFKNNPIVMLMADFIRISKPGIAPFMFDH